MEQTSSISIANFSEPVDDEKLTQLIGTNYKIVSIGISENQKKAEVQFETCDIAKEVVAKFRHLKNMSNDLHVSLSRSREIKLSMRKWKLIVNVISVDSITQNELDAFFGKFGELHHLSFYPEKKIAHIQYTEKASSDLALQQFQHQQNEDQNQHFSGLKLVWPQFKPESGFEYIEIKGLPEDYSEQNLKILLSGFGDVTNISMFHYLPNHDNKVPITHALASLKSRSQRKEAIATLDGKKISRRMIHVSRLLKSSPFHVQYSGDLSELDFFVPIKGKHYIEFINPPEDLNETKLRGICGRFGHVYDVSVRSRCKDNEDLRNSHVAFTTKGPMEKAVKALANDYEVRRMPKSSPYYTYHLQDDSDEGD